MSDDLEPFRAALEDAVDIADRLQVRAMLIGALARELCLPEAVRKSSRKTRDADLALLLEDWAALAGFFAACETHFELRRSDLYMRHRATGAKVDLVPCGDLEKPPGTVRIPRSRRERTTHGLREAFDRATALAFGSRTLRVPSPAAFVLLKCFSFLDRRAPHDLRDAGSVLQRLPFEEDAIWNDAGAMDAFAQGSLEWGTRTRGSSAGPCRRASRRRRGWRSSARSTSSRPRRRPSDG